VETPEGPKARVHIDCCSHKTRDNRFCSSETRYSEDFQVSTSEKCQSLKSRRHVDRRFRIPLGPFSTVGSRWKDRVSTLANCHSEGVEKRGN
jgi:hypothetical protein